MTSLSGFRGVAFRRQSLHLRHDPVGKRPGVPDRMRQPDFPEPIGVFRDVEQERYVDLVRKQNKEAVAKQGAGDIQQLLSGSETWTVA